MKLILAVTAASGAVYARQTAERLAALDCVESVALVYSDVAPTVMAHEGVALPDHPKFVRYDNRDLFAPPASGSARYDAMIVVPCSVGTAGRIASGVSQTLIERAADVMLKERRRLILVVRETPLSLIHLRNLTALAECGAVVLPAAPSFYARPADIESLCATVTERIVALVCPEAEHYESTERTLRTSGGYRTLRQFGRMSPLADARPFGRELSARNLVFPIFFVILCAIDQSRKQKRYFYGNNR